MELKETEPPVEPEEPPSDAEFEGEGDYEESIYADWWQEPDAKGDEAEAGQRLVSRWRGGDAAWARR